MSNLSAQEVIKVGDVKVDYPTEIAYHFYKFFCNVGQSVADKVNRTGNENVMKYVKNRFDQCVLLTPTNLRKINGIISS